MPINQSLVDALESAMRQRDTSHDSPDWYRAGGSLKGDGFLGTLARPDGRVSSELSIADSEDPRLRLGVTSGYMDYPSIVPTLNTRELKTLLTTDTMPDSVRRKAEAHALMRLRQGKPVFAQPGEAVPLPLMDLVSSHKTR